MSKVVKVNRAQVAAARLRLDSDADRGIVTPNIEAWRKIADAKRVNGLAAESTPAEPTDD